MIENLIVSANKFEHCLRPTFTEFLVKKIQRGQSINLIGEHGIGRRRTLDDLQQCLGHDLLILRINLKSYKESYAAFIQELARQLTYPADQSTGLSDLLNQMEKSQKPVLLILHNFDALLGNPQLDAAFDVSFFDHLNSIRNQQNMCLLCVTVLPHDQSVVMIDGQPHSNSWLDLQKSRLPALSIKDLEAELTRRMLQLEGEPQAQLLNLINHHTQAYALLEYIDEKIQLCEDVSVSFPKKLKVWQKEFAQQNKASLLAVHRGVQRSKLIGAVTGLNRMQAPFQAMLALLQKVAGK